MKNFIVPLYPKKLTFGLAKALATLLDPATLARGKRHFLQPFHIENYEKFAKTPRYKNVIDVRNDCISLGIEIEKKQGPLCLIIDNPNRIDAASQFFIDIAQKTLGWQIVIDPQAKAEPLKLSQNDQQLVQVLSSGFSLEFQTHIDLAHKYYRSGDPWSALAILEKLRLEYTEGEKQAEVLYWMMQTQWLFLDVEKTLALSLAVLKLHPKKRRIASTHYLRAMLVMRRPTFVNKLLIDPLAEMTEALRISESITEADAENYAECAVLENGIALIDFAKKNSEVALVRMQRSEAYIEKIKDLDYEKYRVMKPVAISNQARIHVQAGRIEEAIELQKEALALEPNNLENYVHIARTQMSAGLIDDSIKSIEQALELQPGDPALHMMLAQNGVDEESNFLKSIKYAAADDDLESYIFNYCGWLHENEQFEKCRTWLEQVIEGTKDQFTFENAVSMQADVIFKLEGEAKSRQFMQPYAQVGRYNLIVENLNALGQ